MTSVLMPPRPPPPPGNGLIKIVQLNMGRNSAVNLQLLNYCRENGVDIALAQEPYTFRGRLPDLDSPPLRYSLSDGAVRLGNNSTLHGAAIIVFNNSLQVLARTDLDSENFAVCTVTLGTVSINLVSAYFKFRIPTSTHLTELSNILNSLSGNIIVAADVNAHSERWFSDNTNPKGLAVSNFLDHYGMFIINSPSDFFTFHGPRGSSNIDITVSSDPSFIHDWSIVPDRTSSDHAIIRFTVSLGGTFTGSVKPLRYLVKKANWSTFSTHLISALSVHYPPALSSLNDKASALTRVVTEAADAAIPKACAPRISTPPWWTRELGSLRLSLRRAARHRYAPSGGFTEEYLRARNTFVSAVRKAKLSSWKRHCTEGASSMWGPLYKWMRKGTIRSVIPASLVKADGSHTTSMAETAEVLLESLIPNDPHLPSTSLAPLTENQFPILCTYDDLKTALWKCSPT